MEVIIDYYGEDYQCLIRPDKTVNENKQEIAVCCCINLLTLEIVFNGRRIYKSIH